MRKRVLIATITTFMVIATVWVAPSGANENPKIKNPNEKAIGYWTKDRLENALTREFQFEPGAKSGKLVSLGKSARGGGGKTQTTVKGASWTKGGIPLNATGKVFFTMGSQTYVCSGAIVNDSKTDRSLVLTAGHCIFDNETGLFATNFIFYPAFDATPIQDCTVSRCLVANSLVAHSGFTSQTSFTTQATQYDWGFASIPESSIAGFSLNSTPFSNGASSYAFGYPAGSPYGGKDLVYCAGSVISDVNNGGLTWGLGCNMTGGASGGPWLAAFNTRTYNGSASSVNSYKYTNDSTKMYGPKFNAFTVATFAAAEIVTSTTQIVN
jgi:V8-like Glu-specific endopeptidase